MRRKGNEWRERKEMGGVEDRNRSIEEPGGAEKEEETCLDKGERGRERRGDTGSDYSMGVVTIRG